MNTKYILLYILYIYTPLVYPMHNEENPFLSLKLLISLVKNSRYYINENYFWKDSIDIKNYSITFPEGKKSIYLFIQELYEKLPPELIKHIRSYVSCKEIYAQSYTHIKTFPAHEDSLEKLLVDSSNHTLFSTGFDKKIKCWDLSTYNYCYTLEGHTDHIPTLSLGPNNMLFSGSADKTVKCWNTVYKNCIFTLPQPSDVCHVIWHPTYNGIAYTLSDQIVGIYNPTTNVYHPDPTLHDTAIINDIIFDVETNTAISSTWQQAIKFSNNNEERIVQAHTKDIFAFYKKTNSTIVYTGSHDTTIKEWDIQNHSCIHTYTGHTDGLLAFTYNYEEDFLISATRNAEIKIWDNVTKKCMATYNNNTNKNNTKPSTISTIAYDPHTKAIIVGSNDHSISVWKPKIPYETIQNASLLEIIIEEYCT